MSSRSTSETMRAIGRSARQSRTAMLARSVAPSRLAPRQASRSIAFSTFASSTSQSSTLALTTAQASTSSNPTSNHATDRPPRGGPDKTTLLLLESIPQIARYGFTKQAYLRSSSSPDTDELTKRMRIVNTLFPGPASMFDGKLFEAWNTVCDLAVVHNVSPETVLQALRSGQGVGNEGTTAHGKLVNMKRMSSEEERAAIEKVAGIIEERLRLSWSAKAHLTPGITSISTLSPVTTSLHSIFPHQTILPNLPTPLPLLNLTSGFVSLVLTHPTTQARTGFLDPDGPEWYAIRTRLTLAYTAATLHAASPSIAHFQDTQRVFRRVVQGRETGVAATLGEVAGRGKEWVRWGGRGWLGVLRSLGL